MRLHSVFMIVACLGAMSQSVQGMSTVTSLAVSAANSEFFKRHKREFVIIAAAVVAVGVYKSFFARLDRIELLVQDIEGKIINTMNNVIHLDSTVRAEIGALLEKIKQIPNKQEMERMLLELRKILMDDQASLAQQTHQKLFDLEARLCERLTWLERAVEEKLSRIEKRIDSYQETVKAYQKDVEGYQADINQGLNKVTLKQQEIRDILASEDNAVTLKKISSQHIK